MVNGHEEEEEAVDGKWAGVRIQGRRWALGGGRQV